MAQYPKLLIINVKTKEKFTIKQIYKLTRIRYDINILNKDNGTEIRKILALAMCQRRRFHVLVNSNFKTFID